MSGESWGNRPISMDELDAGRESLKGYHVSQLRPILGSIYLWALHVEARLAKYETFAPSPKPGATIVTKHTAFDPDAKPEIMIDLNQFAEFEVLEYSNSQAKAHMQSLYGWASHLESVREGLQAQLNQYERQEKQRLESELATRESEQRDRSSDH